MAKREVPSLSDARRLALEHVEKHLFLPDYVKPLAKEIVVKHFQVMSNSIAALELTARRAQAKKDHHAND